MNNSDECESLFNKFKSRFEEMGDNKIKLRDFETPFNIRPEEAPDSLQLKLIDLQSDNLLKSKSNDLPLLNYKFNNFEKFSESHLNFRQLIYESFFSKLNYTKYRLHTRLTDENTINESRVAVSSEQCNIFKLSKKKKISFILITKQNPKVSLIIFNKIINREYLFKLQICHLNAILFRYRGNLVCASLL